MHLPRVRGKAGVYIIVCRANYRFYIGSSKDLRARWVSHRSDLRRGDHGNKHLQHAWAKYGELQFTVGVMEYCPESDIIFREQYYIDTYRAYEIGFNMNPQAGTCEGRPHSDEAKAKIRSYHIGRTHSLETRKRMSESRQRNTAWVRRSTEKKYTLVSPSGEIVSGRNVSVFARTICRRWRSAFCLEYGLVEQGLDSLLSGKLLTHHGWRLKEPVRAPPMKTIVDLHGVSHSVPSRGLSLFCRNNNLNYRKIHRMIQGQLASYEGWHLP